MPNNDKAVEESLKQELENPEHQTNQAKQEEIKTEEVKKDVTETTAPETTVAKAKLPDGREVDVNQAVEEYKKLLADYTPKSQELAELKKKAPIEQSTATPAKVETPATEMSAQDQAILAEMKKLGVITKDELVEIKKQMGSELVEQTAKVVSSRTDLKIALDELKEDYPFVDKDKVLGFIIKNPNTELTLLEVAKATHTDNFIELEAKKMQKPAKADLPSTEANGVGATEPPQVKYNFKNGSAERAVAEILKNS